MKAASARERPREPRRQAATHSAYCSSCNWKKLRHLTYQKCDQHAATLFCSNPRMTLASCLCPVTLIDPIWHLACLSLKFFCIYFRDYFSFRKYCFPYKWLIFDIFNVIFHCAVFITHVINMSIPLKSAINYHIDVRLFIVYFNGCAEQLQKLVFSLAFVLNITSSDGKSERRWYELIYRITYFIFFRKAYKET